MMEGFRRNTDVRTLAGASAALGMTSGKGIGKLRGLNANLLWIQEVSAMKRATYEKIVGRTNPADMMTKEANRATIEKRI